MANNCISSRPAFASAALALLLLVVCKDATPQSGATTPTNVPGARHEKATPQALLSDIRAALKERRIGDARAMKQQLAQLYPTATENVEANSLVAAFDARLDAEMAARTKENAKEEARAKAKEQAAESKGKRGTPIESGNPGLFAGGVENVRGGALLQELAAYVRADGYACDSISGARPMLMSRGFVLICNEFAYTYDITDKGGTWLVTVE